MARGDSLAPVMSAEARRALKASEGQRTRCAAPAACSAVTSFSAVRSRLNAASAPLVKQFCASEAACTAHPQHKPMLVAAAPDGTALSSWS